MVQYVDAYLYGGNDPINRVDPDGGADYETQENYVSAATSIINDPSLKPRGGTTYCNYGTQAIVDPGLVSPVKGQANDIAKMLTIKDFATKITAGQAIDYAKQGITPIAAWRDPDGGHGHVAAVGPNTDSRGRPNVYNVGVKNGEISIAEAFGKSKRESSNFGYYILNEDLNSLNNRTK